MDSLPIVIIGSGLAGYQTAKQLRIHDKQTPLTIISSENACFYSKPQLSTSFSQGKAASDLCVFSSEQMAKSLDAKILANCPVKAIKPKEQLIETTNGNIKYQKLVLALGAKPNKAPFSIADQVDYFQVNQLSDYHNFSTAATRAETVAIIGSGLVGLEFAHDLTKAGKKVSLISQDDYPLQNFVPNITGQAMYTALTNFGINFHFKQTIDNITKVNDKNIIATKENLNIAADIVLIAIGITANPELAKAAGIECARGIKTNQYLETNLENIYALGDCAIINDQYQAFIMPIMQQAKALGQTLAGSRTAIQYPVMPIIAKTPCCPIRIVLANDLIGDLQWQNIAQDGINTEVNLCDKNNKLYGYALTGEYINKHAELVNLLQK